MDRVYPESPLKPRITVPVMKTEPSLRKFLEKNHKKRNPSDCHSSFAAMSFKTNIELLSLHMLIEDMQWKSKLQGGSQRHLQKETDSILLDKDDVAEETHDSSELQELKNSHQCIHHTDDESMITSYDMSSYRNHILELENELLTDEINQEQVEHEKILYELDALQDRYIAIQRLCCYLIKTHKELCSALDGQGHMEDKLDGIIDCPQTLHCTDECAHLTDVETLLNALLDRRTALNEGSDIHQFLHHKEENHFLADMLYEEHQSHGETLTKLDGLKVQHIILHRLCAKLTRRNKEMQQLIS
eukprot:CAMPEP_0198287492 /NCGR_PEP_ID=MMETSP1449-20131203/6284_1 /TAXON_ID=420275 /ORGANISM="Attheya septentrionalis, Strain CCMP2084" /LENGTH=301 /DNA_ID=CAMNT_0043985451 /DNA_START=167 /DNA_END=1072 /DNA_ORIENTATION=+